MIWFDRAKNEPGDMLLVCATCAETRMLTMPLAAYVVEGHLRDFEKKHQHGRQPGEPVVRNG